MKCQIVCAFDNAICCCSDLLIVFTISHDSFVNVLHQVRVLEGNFVDCKVPAKE